MRNFDRPQYALEMKNDRCAFVAFINDIPAFINRKGAPFSMTVPINHLLLNGENTFRFTAVPKAPAEHLEELAECKASILVKGWDMSASEMTDVATIGFPAGTSNRTLQLPLVAQSGKFEASLPFEDSRWSTAQKLDTENDRGRWAELAGRYFTKFHAALRAKDIAFVSKEITMRERELSQAFYEPLESSISMTRDDFQGTLDDPAFELQEIDLLTYIPKFYADGRLITFENSKYQQAIYFRDRVKRLRREYPLYLCADGQGGLTLIR